jgi:MarR family transcriptional regulator, temperature-dependent positive regulator of motility
MPVQRGDVPDLSPSQSIFHMLRVIQQEHGALWTRRLAATPAPELTKPQYAVLRVVRACPGIDQVSAGHLAATDTATIAALLDKLERRGLLWREVNPGDRRRRQLHLTAWGKNVLAATEQVISALNEELLSRLTPREQAQLGTLLRKLTTSGTDPAAAP